MFEDPQSHVIKRKFGLHVPCFTPVCLRFLVSIVVSLIQQLVTWSSRSVCVSPLRVQMFSVFVSSCLCVFMDVVVTEDKTCCFLIY